MPIPHSLQRAAALFIAALIVTVESSALVVTARHLEEDPARPTLVLEGSTATLAVVSPDHPFMAFWNFDDSPIAGSSSLTLSLFHVTAAHSGNYQLVPYNFTDETDITNTVTLNVLSAAQLATSPAAAEIVASDELPPLGSSVTLTANILSGQGPYRYEWLALDHQPLPFSTHESQLTLAAFTANHYGRYQVRITNGSGVTTLSRVCEFHPLVPPRFAALAGRGIAGPGEATLIAGLTAVSRSLGRSALFRGVGPGLRSLGVSDALNDPVITVYLPYNLPSSSSSDWTYDGRELGAFPLEPGSKDATLQVRSIPGNATIHLTSEDGSTGVALLEIYRTPSGVPYRRGDELLNLSFRARTAPGEATAIAGFVIEDHLKFGRPKRVLLRAVGPTLTSQGIAAPLPDPVLTVYNSQGEVIAQNDDWAVANSTSPADLTAAMQQAGVAAFDPDSKDAALLLDLPAGAYTMHATGGTGIVLLEIYSVR